MQRELWEIKERPHWLALAEQEDPRDYIYDTLEACGDYVFVGYCPTPSGRGGECITHWVVRLEDKSEAWLRECFKCLRMSGGARIDERDTDNATALDLAVRLKRHDAVEALLLEEADPNVWHPSYTRPLHHARGDQDMTYLLLRHGADPSLSGCGLDEFLKVDQVYVMRAMRERIPQTTLDGLTFTMWNASSPVKYIEKQIALGVNIAEMRIGRNEGRNPGDTFYHWLVRVQPSSSMEPLALIKLVHAQGLPLDALNGTGDTPLTLARMCSSKAMVEALEAAGADDTFEP